MLASHCPGVLIVIKSIREESMYIIDVLCTWRRTSHRKYMQSIEISVTESKTNELHSLIEIIQGDSICSLVPGIFSYEDI